MPSRLLREGILESTAVNELSFPAEVFYRRLMSVVDDFGRFDGRPAVLRGRLYSLKLDTVREADISRWIAECEKAGLIVLYTVQDKPYILFQKLGPARAKQSKFPAPPGQPDEPTAQNAGASSGEQRQADVNGCAQVKADVNGCAQVKADVPYSGSYSGSGSGSGSPLPPAERGEAGGANVAIFDPTADPPERGPSADDVVAHWNSFPALIPATASDPNRDRAIRSRQTDPQWCECWRAVIAFMGSSPLYTGAKTGWRPTLGWLFDRGNFAKVLDESRAPVATGPPAGTDGASIAARSRANLDRLGIKPLAYPPRPTKPPGAA